MKKFEELVNEFVVLNCPKVFKLENPSMDLPFEEGDVVYLSSYIPKEFKIPEGLHIVRDTDEYQREYFFLSDGREYVEMMSSKDVIATARERRSLSKAVMF